MKKKPEAEIPKGSISLLPLFLPIFPQLFQCFLSLNVCLSVLSSLFLFIVNQVCYCCVISEARSWLVP